MGALQPADLLRTLATQAAHRLPDHGRSGPRAHRPGRPVARCRRGARRRADRSGRGARPPHRRLSPRRCRAWPSRSCVRSSRATVEPLPRRRRRRGGAARGLRHGAGAGRAGDAGRLGAASAAERIATRSRPVAPAACSTCAANRGCGSASRASAAPEEIVLPSRAVRVPDRVAHGRLVTKEGASWLAAPTRTERAADAARQLDRIASDIANASTAGYKTERVPTVEARRPDFGQVLQTAIDVAAAPGLIDFRDGSIETTDRDLDVALEGRGFFVDRDDRRARATRATASSRAGRTARWSPPTAPMVRGDSGTAITAGAGRDLLRAGRLGPRRRRPRRQAQDRRLRRLRRPAPRRWRAASAPRPARRRSAAPATARVRGGSLEASNVQLAERMVQLTEVSRAFEALQRGVSDADERRRRPRHLGAGAPLGGSQTDRGVRT